MIHTHIAGPGLCWTPTFQSLVALRIFKCQGCRSWHLQVTCIVFHRFEGARVLPGSSRLPMFVNILDIITISENQHHFQPNYAKIFQHYPKFDCCFHTLGCNEVLLVEWKWAWMINWYKLQSWSDSGQTDCILGQLQVIPNHILDHFGTCTPDRKHQTHSKFDWLSLDLVIIPRYSNPEKLIIVADWNLECRTPSGRAVLKNAAAGAKS